MQILINDRLVEAYEGETLLEAARRAGHDIPSLCFAPGVKHKSSCMVCAVKNMANGQIIPSCATYPEEGMCITTDSEEVMVIRNLSLELLLSDHRADCEAPCSMVCPRGLDVEKMLACYDTLRHSQAYEIIASAFPDPATGCDGCKAPCEKACRRGSIDKAVEIRVIIREIAAMFVDMPPVAVKKKGENGKFMFRSHLGRFTDEEKTRLKKTVTTPSRCLHCACEGQEGCLLRLHATTAAIKRPHYNSSSALPAMDKVHITGNMWFEKAKCIRCGLCVYNSINGFTFKGRGFGMEIVVPPENRTNLSEELAALCPTGALYLH